MDATQTPTTLWEESVTNLVAIYRDIERRRLWLPAISLYPEIEAPHLDEYTWHGNRHTFASRLAMAGVDPLTIKEVGGWRTLAMVQRHAHLAPGHLHAAVERLVKQPAGVVELARN